MIFTVLISMATYLLTFILAIFPQSSGLPEGFTDAADTVGGYVGLIDTLLPVNALAFCITTLISVQLAIFGFKSFKWLISHLPFIGGKG